MSKNECCGFNHMKLLGSLAAHYESCYMTAAQIGEEVRARLGQRARLEEFSEEFRKESRRQHTPVYCDYRRQLVVEGKRVKLHYLEGKCDGRTNKGREAVNLRLVVDGSENQCRECG